MSVVVKTDPVLEAIARKLSGIAGAPPMERERMIRRAAKAGREALLAEQAYEDRLAYNLEEAE